MILTACDSAYLKEAACLIRSCARYVPEQKFYLFLVNGENITDETFRSWHPQIMVDRVLWNFEPQRWHGLMCAARSGPIEKALHQYHEKLLYIDSDCLVRAPLNEVFQALDHCDLMVKYRPQMEQLGAAGTYFASKFNSGVVAIRPSDPGLRFAHNYHQAIQEFITSGKPLELPLEEEKIISVFDQELLYATYLQLKEDLTFTPLPDKFNDSKFNPGSAIWHGKGTARTHPLYRLERAHYQHQRLSPIFTVFSSILFAARATKRKIIP